MTKDEALQKIKKCLALAASPEAHEAAAAMRQAQKLMAQFGLSEVDVSLADVKEKPQQAQNAPLVIWEGALANMVATAFGCELLTNVRRSLTSGGRLKNVREFVFIGVGAAADVAGYAFDVLARQCARDRRAYVSSQPTNCKPKTKVARGDRYAEGWVMGVRDKLETFAARPEQEALLTQYVASRYSDLKTVEAADRAKGRNITDNDIYHGHRAGANADLNRGLSGRAEQALIGG